MQHLDGPTSIFSGILYYFLDLLEAHDFLKEAQFHCLKIILFLLCHGDTLGELVNTPWTHHVLHLFFVEWDPRSYGDLVSFMLYYWIESFSFVRGLWLLDMDNRKTFLVEILGSPLHLVFLDGDWKIYCFPSIWVFFLRSIFFFGNILLSTSW